MAQTIFAVLSGLFRWQQHVGAGLWYVVVVAVIVGGEQLHLATHPAHTC